MLQAAHGGARQLLPPDLPPHVWPRSLLTLGHVNDQHHHVDDLHAADDGADERGVARAVHQRELQLVVRPQAGQVGRQRNLRAAGDGGSRTQP